MKKNVLLLLLCLFSLIVKSQNWHAFLDRKQEWIDILNEYFGDDLTYIGTRSINDKIHIVFLENNSVTRKVNFLEAKIYQMDWQASEANQPSTSYMIYLCDCDNYKLKLIYIYSANLGKGLTADDEDWMNGIGDTYWARVLNTVCAPYYPITEKIPLVKENGTYKIAIKINDVVSANFIFDTGASDLYISRALFEKIKSQSLLANAAPYIRTSEYKDANGNIQKCNVYLLKSVQIGKRKIYNVECAVANDEITDYLLGQSFLEKLGRFEFDYAASALIFR